MHDCPDCGQACYCVGAFDEKDPKLTYKLSGWNAFMAVIGNA